jgi:hypothetical protein
MVYLNNDLGYIALNEKLIGEKLNCRGCGMWPALMYFHGICLEGLSKTSVSRKEPV